MNLTSPLTHMAEFNFAIAWSLKYRCSFVGVTWEGTELVTWKLHSVWKQVRTPEDLTVLLRFFPFLDTAKHFLHTACHPAGQNPTLLRGIRILWDFQHYHSHYSWNGGQWSLWEQKVLAEWSELVKFTKLLEILPVVRSKCQSDWLDKPHVLL